MENASKALIIAGSILLAILIIGLGVFIYNNASNTIGGSANLNQMEIAKHNGQFDQYINKSISGASAKSLLKAIEANNYNGEIPVEYEGTSISNIKRAHTYTTEVIYQNSFITKIVLTDTDESITVGDNGNGGSSGNNDPVTPGGEGGEFGGGTCNEAGGFGQNEVNFTSTEFNMKFKTGIISYDQYIQLRNDIADWNTYRSAIITNAPEVIHFYSGDALVVNATYNAVPSYDSNGFIYRINVSIYNSGSGGLSEM